MTEACRWDPDLPADRDCYDDNGLCSCRTVTDEEWAAIWRALKANQWALPLEPGRDPGLSGPARVGDDASGTHRPSGDKSP